MTCTSYCKKIEEIFDAMIRLSDEVLPENRTEVNEYICTAWTKVGIFTRSIRWEMGTDELRAKFKSHVDAEEERLRKNLEGINYDIAEDYLAFLVMLPERIETVRSFSLHIRTQLSSGQSLLPMFYLMLQRDLQKIDIARKHVLSESELVDAAEGIGRTAFIAECRVANLECKEVVIIRRLGLPGIRSEIQTAGPVT